MRSRRIEQIRRRWWVVLLVTVVAAGVAALPSLFSQPTYVGKSALVIASPGRAPEQDAMMVVGYAALFNEPATIQRLRDTTTIPGNVTFDARTVATSPILIVEATASSPDEAQDSAVAMAGAFRDDVNSVRQRGSEDAVKALEQEYNNMLIQEPAAPDGSPNPLLTVLRQRIDDVRFDTTNQLMDLQLRAGVSSNASNVPVNIVLGTVSGLLLGILAALGMAKLSRQLRNSADLEDKTGVDVLAEVPKGGSEKKDRVRDDRLRTLANLVHFQDFKDSPKSTVISLTDCRGARAARELSEELAKLSAQQGYRTVLVHADNHASHPDLPGFNEGLIDSSVVHELLIDGEVESLQVLPAGSVIADRYTRMNQERIVSVLDELRTRADFVVIAAPAITDTAETQLVCAAADLTMLVVGKRASQTGDVVMAVEALKSAHADLLGAILIDASNGDATHRRPKASSTRRSSD